nr:hypothetical protein [Lysinibacillus timonensis]
MYYYHQFPYHNEVNRPARVTAFNPNLTGHHQSEHPYQWAPRNTNYSNPAMNQQLYHHNYYAQRQPNQQPPTNPTQQQNPNEYQYPPADPSRLNQSATESQQLMKDASKVLDRLATSRDFGSKLMNSAQRSDQAEVNRLIDSIGVESKVKISYNPDGLRLEFQSKVTNVDCCKLDISLRWQ